MDTRTLQDRLDKLKQEYEECFQEEDLENAIPNAYFQALLALQNTVESGNTILHQDGREVCNAIDQEVIASPQLDFTKLKLLTKALNQTNDLIKNPHNFDTIKKYAKLTQKINDLREEKSIGTKIASGALIFLGSSIIVAGIAASAFLIGAGLLDFYNYLILPLAIPGAIGISVCGARLVEFGLGLFRSEKKLPNVSKKINQLESDVKKLNKNSHEQINFKPKSLSNIAA